MHKLLVFFAILGICVFTDELALFVSWTDVVFVNRV